MKIVKKEIALDDDDLKNIFALFCSPTKQERAQAHEPTSVHHYSKVDLSGEYSLTQERREYSLDAWRAVLEFLRTKGVRLRIGEQELDLAFIEEAFLK
ncbi:MAG: hypothetical protein COV48_09985 [Elusimicrobia bacterium CG11_big_fil_rev_8_21_14_0_20_64_6]|nr:MAG: hypothetical protein COV48_09985 [Elusimicrobia bacterium CG11_big_fil_rev_8_21_14_0_20_64_6]